MRPCSRQTVETGQDAIVLHFDCRQDPAARDGFVVVVQGRSGLDTCQHVEAYGGVVGVAHNSATIETCQLGLLVKFNGFRVLGL
jgi:hypothetical protein